MCLCVARACRHHLSRVHPYRVGVQSEPDCSSPSYIHTCSTPPHRKWSKSSGLKSQRPHGPPMANPTPSIRVAPPDGAGNPIPERFPLGLAPKKPGPLAPARASGPPKPTTRKGRLRVSIAGREGRPHARGWLCVCLPDRTAASEGGHASSRPLSSHPRAGDGRVHGAARCLSLDARLRLL